MDNQTMDRAFPIGEGKNVRAHKLQCVGMREERIDEMIERKEKSRVRCADQGLVRTVV